MQRLISLDVCDYSGNVFCNLYDSSSDLTGQATDVFTHTERNGFKELRFKLPSVCEDERNYRLDFLVSDYRIRFRADKDGTVETDWFLISESKVTHNAFSTNYEIKASHISKLLNTKNLNLEFSDAEGNNVGTIGEIAATILEGTGWHLNYVTTFYEEDKYSRGEQVEKVRSFTASAKTGAFKMMSNLCELFDAKPIYHGEGTYEEDGETKVGRTVDIIPMNPFSEKLEEGVVPPDLDKEKILELYYDKNVKNIVRTLNTDTLVTVFNAYGSYGDRNGMASLQTAEHAVITFSNLEPGEYKFEYQNARYFFTLEEAVSEITWSSLDPTSRSYLYDGNTLVKTYKEPKTNNYTVLSDLNITYEKNQLPYLMDFTYYQKVGLLNDEMLLKIAQAQTNLPAKHVAAQEASIALSDIKQELSRTASSGNGYLMLDVLSTGLNKGYVQLTLNKTTHKDGIIFRSDYDEAKRNRFSWNVATGIKLNGEAIAGQGAVVYIVHEGDPTQWVKSYVKALGNGTDDYYRDSLGNIYKLHTEDSYGDMDHFPSTGVENVIYVAEDTAKTYVWFNSSYVEIKPSNYYYGLNEFEEPDTITLWCTDDTWQSGDKVYMFSSDSIAGVFGPREDSVYANKKSIEEATKVSTETHPVYFVTDSETASVTACLDGYGWLYRSYTNTFNFGDLYFCWGKAGDLDWNQVYVSDSDDNPELIPYISGYNYYYSIKRMMVYKRDGDTYRPVNKTVDEEKITNAFTAVIEGCTNQEVLTKGMCEVYNFSDEQNSLPIGNYAFKNEFNNYWLFTTDMAISDPSLLRYIPADKIVWQDNDEHHVLKGIEHSFRYLDFPKENELYETTFIKGGYSNQAFSPEGDKFISANIYVHDNTEYEANLPAGSVVVCLAKAQQVLGEYSTSTFTTPNNTTHVRVVCNEQPDEARYLRVANYDKVLFCKNVKYEILSCAGNGERLGIYYLMDKFIELSNEAYLVRLPALQQAQQDITDINLDLSETLGDMYREGFWQENNYVEGDEDKLYIDALDNLKEISHPQAKYDVTYLELHDSDDNLGATKTIEYPDVDITFAAHLVDMDIDTNRWAYIDSVDKCHDKPWQTTIEINTRLSTIGQQSFTDVLAKIAEVANETKAKQTIYSKAEAIGGAGQFAAENLEGALLANKIYILGGTANWYTDSKGNIVLEDADGNSAMMLTGRGLMVSQEKDIYGDWAWKTALTGKGFNADVITTGELSAKHIIAGTITVDKLASSVGQEMDIASNKALLLYATADGSRPAGGLETAHPDPTDSYIKIAAATDDDPAYVDIQSGGLINVYGGSSVNIESGGLLNIRGGQINVTAQGKLTINSGTVLDIKSGGELLIDSDNFSIQRNALTGQHDVTIVGDINATGGHIAGFTVGTSGQRTYMYADGKQSVSDTGPGVYIGTDGINIAGKLMFNTDGTLRKLVLDADQTFIGDVTLNNAINKSFYKTKTEMLSETSFKVGDTWQDSAANSLGLTYVCKKTWDVNYDSSTFDNYWSPVGSAAVSGAKLIVDAVNGTINMVAANTVNIASGTNLNISSGTVNITTVGLLTIGNGANPFTIGASNGYAFIRNGVTGISDTSHNGVYLGTNGIVLGMGKFIVLPDGSLTATAANISGTITATSGKISNWFIKSNYIGNAETSQLSTVGCGGTSTAFWAGHDTNYASITNSAFYVLNDGTLKATSATIVGSVTATSGKIGDFIINSALYTSAKPTIDTNANGVYIGTNGISLGQSGKFKVTNIGVLTATGVDVTGTIRASELYINNVKANLSLDSNGHISIGSLSTINLSATNFDYLGVSQAGRVYITPTSINMGVSSNGVTIDTNGVAIKGTAKISMYVNSSNYIDISKDGIVMKGKKLWIYDSGNNKVETWGRDDIIILKNSGETESQIISRQSTKHDWVLIKPYYNAEIKGIPNTGTVSLTNTASRCFHFVQQGGSTSAFGTSTWYKYKITGKFRHASQTGGSVEFRLSNTELTSSSDPAQVTLSTTISASAAGTTSEFSKTSDQLTTNLCGEDAIIYCYVYGLANGSGTYFDVVLTCTCASVTQKVPCTVYYYP